MSALPRGGDHYEFTYEIQDVIVPWARETGTPLCPFDWLPSPEDSALAFGVDDLERPPFLRRPSGFQGFVSFPEPRSLTDGLFFADAEEERARHRSFYGAYPEQPRGDFARRLFLYRTFLQARRIAAAARAYPGGRVLVVVGVMHKDDIERILAGDPRIRIVQPSAIAREPDAVAVARETRAEHLFAIAHFNLLGAQSRTGNVDRSWMEVVVRQLERERPGPESRLLRLRLDEAQGRLDYDNAIPAYLGIAAEAGDLRFTWDGVKDRSRIDSIYDPFANLTIAQRAQLEAARVHQAAGRDADAEHLRAALRETLAGDDQRYQLDAYWRREIAALTP
ncbi:MAG: hypothetical protein ACK4K7_08660 [Allosphingosinicella sp.]|uniref:hypothetical protein n=1 Tax=Allosphingosinicella sp. TaxID=2823234 RepID=UPI003925F1B1